MAITTQDGLVSAIASAQRARILKTTTRTTVANIPFTMFDVAGDPGAGTLAGTSTTAGVVPTDATAGFPAINAFAGGAKGYMTRFEASNTVACRMALYDCLWKAGAYAFNANVTLSSQPSYSTRVTFGGVQDYTGLELWIECVTAFTGNQSIAVTYTNEGGTTGRSTGTIATGVAPTVGRMLRLNLQAGDKGIQKVESVVSSVATVGTFNVLVMREIAECRIRVANDQIVMDWNDVGLPLIFEDSAFYGVVYADSTSSGLPEWVFDIANG